MLSVIEAKKLVMDHVPALPSIRKPLSESLDYTLAHDVFAPASFPPFRQSSMDGYAFAFDDWCGMPLSLKGEIAAGARELLALEQRNAVRIFTGAPLPIGADTVVMQEKTIIANGMLSINDEQLSISNNVRQVGSEIEKGALALKKGDRLTPAAIGLLAGLGINEVDVSAKPTIGILITGTELQQPGLSLKPGQVYDSNSYALSAALTQFGHVVSKTLWVDDDPVLLNSAIDEMIEQTDLLLITGGVSVGEYDFVSQALIGSGATIFFHKVKQRPGKPLLFGTKNNTIIFGLPGNPSSVLSCFYQYVLLALQQFAGATVPYLQTSWVPLAAPFKKVKGLTQYLKGNYKDGLAWPLTAQESYRMHSFATANCLLELAEDREAYNEGEMINIYHLS